ncbi:MAG: DUF3718 domain-containing protein [Pseudomonadota bacterium]
MNVLGKGLMGFLAFAPVSLLADTALTDAKVHYRGTDQDVRVCRAVVEDDVATLQDALEDVRRDNYYGYRYTLWGEDLAGNILCNEMPLHDFAADIGASNSTLYLQTGQTPSNAVAGALNR